MPEGERVELTIEPAKVKEEETKPPMSEGLAKVYEILGERYSSLMLLLRKQSWNRCGGCKR